LLYQTLLGLTSVTFLKFGESSSSARQEDLSKAYTGKVGEKMNQNLFDELYALLT
jgi:hypothetical protein